MSDPVRFLEYLKRVGDVGWELERQAFDLRDGIVRNSGVDGGDIKHLRELAQRSKVSLEMVVSDLLKEFSDES